MTAKKDLPDWMPRQQPLTDKKARSMLYALMRTGNVSEACRLAKCNRTAVYQKVRRDEVFAAAFEECKHIGACTLEETAIDRAVNGWDEPVFHDGEECGTKRKYSPALMIFLLKAHSPERYRERYDIQQSGAGGGPIEFNIVMDPRAVEESANA